MATFGALASSSYGKKAILTFAVAWKRTCGEFGEGVLAPFLLQKGASGQFSPGEEPMHVSQEYRALNSTAKAMANHSFIQAANEVNKVVDQPITAFVTLEPMVEARCAKIREPLIEANTAVSLSLNLAAPMDGTKAEEPKYGISLHKRHRYPGSKGHKATRSKRQKFAVGAPGTTVEEPKIGASLHERYHYPGRKGPERSAPGVVSGVSRGRPG
ncbi:hypothetical protein M0R45_013840 [Rubus argutus]|uniref:Uncharacterized protein n=1 Tax=Rubus argutus TaxID=59490 RepID=A0AAW1XN45_RUBAR